MKININYCASCGQETVKSHQYCKECGCLLSNQKGSGNHAGSNFFQNNRKVIMIGGIILVIFFLMFNKGKESPVDVDEKFIEYSRDGEWEKGEMLYSKAGIEKLVTGIESRERSVYIAMSNLGDRIFANPPMKIHKYKVGHVKTKGSKSIVNFDILFTNGRREMATFSMEKENGEWKVFDFHTVAN